MDVAIDHAGMRCWQNRRIWSHARSMRHMITRL